MIPGMSLWRPCDTVETAVAWKAGIEKTDGPCSLVLTRQGLAPQPRSESQIQDIARGGYVLVDSDGKPDALIIATGSEVALAVGAAATLSDAGHKIPVKFATNMKKSFRLFFNSLKIFIFIR